jgi:hypothetical protein
MFKGMKWADVGLELFSHLDKTPSSVELEYHSSKIGIIRFWSFIENFQLTSLLRAISNGDFLEEEK